MTISYHHINHMNESEWAHWYSYHKSGIMNLSSMDLHLIVSAHCLLVTQLQIANWCNQGSRTCIFQMCSSSQGQSRPFFFLSPSFLFKDSWTIIILLTHSKIWSSGRESQVPRLAKSLWLRSGWNKAKDSQGPCVPQLAANYEPGSVHPL